MLTDEQMEALAGLLRDRTALNRLALRSELIPALRFLESQGYGISAPAVGNRENVNG